METNYFASKIQKALRRLPGGSDMAIAYLKMQLRYASTNGQIDFLGLYPTLSEEIANDIDEATETVQLVLAFLQKVGLVTENYTLLEVEKRIGSKTVGAEKKEIQRKRGQTADKLRTLSASTADKFGHIDIEKEIELERDTELDTSTSIVSNTNNEHVLSEQNESAVFALESMTIAELVTKCFEKFYRYYPRRENRKDAERAYGRIFKNYRVKVKIVQKAQVILSGLNAALAEWTRAGTERRFIPLPATWLNGERWTNETPTVPDSIEADLLGDDAHET